MTALRSLGIATAAIGIAAVALGATTLLALEADGVAVLATRRADGSLRQTHVWFAQRGDDLWVEVGAPENGWWIDAQADPDLAFRAESAPELTGRYLARVDRDPDAHPRLRDALRAKYGWRDCVVGIWVDSSRSLAVQLVPLPEDDRS